MKELLVKLFPLFLMLLLVACGPAYRGEPIYGPLDRSEPKVVLGEKEFYEYCHQCHPGGTAGQGFAVNNRPLPGWLIKFQVRNGVGAMPAFSEEQISESELDALVEYLFALRANTDVASE